MREEGRDAVVAGPVVEACVCIPLEQVERAFCAAECLNAVRIAR
jgi:hypothetical protein